MATSKWENVRGAFATASDEAAFWTGRTFDDFLFRPQKTDSQTRRNISVSSLLTAELALDLPIVSSNMDSVTGADMARAMAMHGGVGVVHRGMSIERQAAEVGVVKRSQNAVIVGPLCLPAGTEYDSGLLPIVMPLPPGTVTFGSVLLIAMPIIPCCDAMFA